MCIEKSCKLVVPMGCLKLEHSAYLPVLKVAKGFFLSEEKTGASPYRYGFNGMEKDDEVKGNNNHYTTPFRQYDPRIGRWMSLDPLMDMFPDVSPYVAFDNNPIYFADPSGLCPDCPKDGGTLPESTTTGTGTEMPGSRGTGGILNQLALNFTGIPSSSSGGGIFSGIGDFFSGVGEAVGKYAKQADAWVDSKIKGKNYTTDGGWVAKNGPDKMGPQDLVMYSSRPSGSMEWDEFQAYMDMVGGLKTVNDASYLKSRQTKMSYDEYANSRLGKSYFTKNKPFNGGKGHDKRTVKKIKTEGYIKYSSSIDSYNRKVDLLRVKFGAETLGNNFVENGIKQANGWNSTPALQGGSSTGVQEKFYLKIGEKDSILGIPTNVDTNYYKYNPGYTGNGTWSTPVNSDGSNK